mmetsp:Transcript_29573/g.75943  ORF Transcript_29573/g.75943 Transcript_29573/m.75943 type:complete len:218 (+) Transcript_29573:639-1292(+)
MASMNAAGPHIITRASRTSGTKRSSAARSTLPVVRAARVPLCDRRWSEIGGSPPSRPPCVDVMTQPTEPWLRLATPSISSLNAASLWHFTDSSMTTRRRGCVARSSARKGLSGVTPMPAPSRSTGGSDSPPSPASSSLPVTTRVSRSVKVPENPRKATFDPGLTASCMWFDTRPPGSRLTETVKLPPAGKVPLRWCEDTVQVRVASPFPAGSRPLCS